MADKHDYVIGRKAEPHTFQVSKFGDDGVPLNVYRVVYNPQTGYGKCDCPAAVYRQTGSADKHVKMVREWLIQQGGISMPATPKAPQPEKP